MCWFLYIRKDQRDTKNNIFLVNCNFLLILYDYFQGVVTTYSSKRCFSLKFIPLHISIRFLYLIQLPNCSAYFNFGCLNLVTSTDSKLAYKNFIPNEYSSIMKFRFGFSMHYFTVNFRKFNFLVQRWLSIKNC